MGYERNPRGADRFGGNQDRDHDDGRDYGSGRDYTYSSARDNAAAGQYGDRDEARDPYGSRDYYGGGRGGQGQRDGYGRGGQTQQGYGQQGYGQQGYGADRDEHRGQSTYGRPGADRNRFADPDRGNFDRNQPRGRGFSGQPQGYDYEERGFMDRAGDEVRSWFGDDEAERRRELDRREDERHGGGRSHGRDEHYDSWRRKQVADLDRDYDEYRRENSQKFENEFTSFRTERQTQRTSLSQVKEHMEVVGSDDGHVGTVDKVRGDRIILTKNDQDAGGRHHSIPSRWIESVGDKVKIRKTADEAQALWRDEEANQAFFKENDRQDHGRTTAATDRTATDRTATDRTGDAGATNLNRSFPGTY